MLEYVKQLLHKRGLPMRINYCSKIERIRKAINSLADQLVWHILCYWCLIFAAFFLPFHHVRSLIRVLLPHEQVNYKANKKTLKSTAVPCAWCSGGAQILPCRKTHDRRYCICKEILLFAPQSFPWIPFPLSCMNRYTIWYKQEALFFSLC